MPRPKPTRRAAEGPRRARKPARRTARAAARPPRPSSAPRTRPAARAAPRKAAPAAPALPPEGAYAHVELYSDAPEATRRFFAEAFGWTFEDVSYGPGMTYTSFRAKGAPHGGLMPRPAGGFQPPATLAYLRVGDIEATARRIEAAGGKALAPPFQVPNVGWFLVFEAPGGIVQAAWAPDPGFRPRA